MSGFSFEGRELRSNASGPELADRLARARSMMDDAGVDVLLITSPQAALHLTGVWMGLSSASPPLLLTRTDHRMFTRKLDRNWQQVWSAHTWADSWINFDDFDDLANVYATAILELAGPRAVVGLEADTVYMPRPLMDQIERLTTAAAVIDLAVSVRELRARKSASEIALMREASAITVIGMDAVVATIAAGGSDTSAAVASFAAMAQAGSEHFGVGPFVVSGPVARANHLSWMQATAQPGEPTVAMLSGFVGAYACPLERVFYRGHYASGVEKELRSVAEAIAAVVSDIRPGMTGADVDAIARGVHARNGYRDRFVHRTGYSTGSGWPDLDQVQLHAGDHREIQVGMTFHLVPHILSERTGLSAISQPIVITEQGAELLIDYPLVIEPL